MQTLDLGGVELDARHGEPLADCESGGVADAQPECVVRLLDDVGAFRIGIEYSGRYPLELDTILVQSPD